MSSTRAQVALRSAASVALLVGGLVHLQLYFLGYRSFPDPNLGRSLLLNVAASAVVAALIALRGGRALEISGIVVAASTLVFFTVTRSSDALFGFRETGLSPSPQAIIAIVAEVAAVALLAASLATSWSRERVYFAPRLPRRPFQAPRAAAQLHQHPHLQPAQPHSAPQPLAAKYTSSTSRSWKARWPCPWEQPCDG